MPKLPPVDRETFLQWREQTVTRLVLGRLKDQATERALTLGQDLFNLLNNPASEWADRQPNQARLRGQCEGIMEVVALDYEEILTADELEAVKDMEKRSNG